MARRALGKGWEVLFPEGGLEQAARGRVLELTLQSIVPNPYQPRQVFDEGGLKEMAASMKAKGVLQPIAVRQVGADSYELIAGERRWRAAQMAGLKRIPAVIMAVTDEEMVELALVENLQRLDLNPIEAARAYSRLTKEFKLTQEEIAKRVGKERSSVANLMRLLGLPEEIQEDLLKERITTGHAKALLALQRPADQIKAWRRIIGEGLSVRKAEALVRALNRPEAKRKVRENTTLKAMEERLQAHFGTKVKIQDGAAGGRIIITYYSAEDLERILGRLLN